VQGACSFPNVVSDVIFIFISTELPKVKVTTKGHSR